MPSNPRRPSKGQEFDVAHAMRTFLKQMASDAFRSAPRSLRSSSRTPMMPEPPTGFTWLTTATEIRAVARALATGTSRPPVVSIITKSAGSSRLANSLIPVASLATARLLPFGQIATSNCAWPRRSRQTVLHPPSPHLITLLPSLAIRDFLPFQPFGPDHCEGAAIFADRKGFGPLYGNGCRRTIDRGGAASRCLVALALLTAGGGARGQNSGIGWLGRAVTVTSC